MLSISYKKACSLPAPLRTVVNMNRLTNNTHQAPQSLSPIRTSADLTAYAVHSLGYWPEQSIVLIAASSLGIGPCMRADLVDLETDKHKRSFLTELIDMMPSCGREGEPFTQVFCLIFGPTGTAEAQRIHAGYASEPDLERIQNDAAEAGKAQKWVRAVYQAVERSPLELKCILSVNTYTRWHLNDPAEDFQFEGFIDDIITSDHYADMVLQGSCPAATAEENATRSHWNVDATKTPEAAEQWYEDARFWAQSYRAMTQQDENYCRNYTAQKHAEFILWEKALNTVLTLCLPEHRHQLTQHWADAIRASIPAECMGFLASTMTTMGTSQLVLGATCAGLPTVVQALAELEDMSPTGKNTRAVSSALLLPKETIGFDVHDLGGEPVHKATALPTKGGGG